MARDPLLKWQWAVFLSAATGGLAVLFMGVRGDATFASDAYLILSLLPLLGGLSLFADLGISTFNLAVRRQPLDKKFYLRRALVGAIGCSVCIVGGSALIAASGEGGVAGVWLSLIAGPCLGGLMGFVGSKMVHVIFGVVPPGTPPVDI